MCGIAGAIDLRGSRRFPDERLLRMTGAMSHRGPDDEQIYIDGPVALGVRRLSVIDVAQGRQPISNETGDVWVAYEGELYEYPDLRTELLARGHTLRTHCDTEAWVHLYEDFGDQVFDHARGQFGVSLWDRRSQTLLLGRDRFGISPLFYAEVDGWLIWASEIKGLLASGLIQAKPDVKGLDCFFNFFAMPQTRTCFEGIRCLPPGHFMKVHDGHMEIHKYWDFDYPDAGEERRFESIEAAAEEFEDLLRGAVRRRLVGEMPMCCYISGGLDSTTILGLGCQEHDKPLPSFTIGLDGSGPNDERTQAAESASLLGSPLNTVSMTSADIANTFPELIRAAESPVLDTSAACMIRLAHAARSNGNIVALTGEGSDELLGGYIWFKANQIVLRTGRSLNRLARRFLFGTLVGGNTNRLPPWEAMNGVRVAQQFSWEIMRHSRESLYSPSLWSELGDYDAYGELPQNDRMKRWHPLNQSLYAASRVMLPGMLLSAKGDRALRNGSTEGRFPFLDERVVDFCCSIDPSLKLRRWTDKRVLRAAAKRVLPKPIANRPKTMFRADFSGTFLGDDRPAWVDQLLSPESLRATGLFDAKGVERARKIQKKRSKLSFQRFVLDMGLTGVISTQLWHHIYCGGGLADVPEWSPPQTPAIAGASPA